MAASTVLALTTADRPCEVRSKPWTIHGWRPTSADESDNHLMEWAVAGGAAAIITNNVRDLKSGELIFPDIGIMTPASFLKTMNLKTTRRRP